METLQALADWMAALPPGWVYVFVLVVTYAENIIPPLPGDMAVVLAGSLVGIGVVGVVPVLALSVVGSTAGFLTMYAVGRWLGEAVHNPARLRWIPREPVRVVDRWFARHGVAVVAVNRFLTGVRALIALMSGGSGMAPLPVALWSAVSALLWNGLLIAGGYAVGTEWERVLDVLRLYGRMTSVVLGIIVLGGALAWRWQRRRRQETAKTRPPGMHPPGAR